jgi:hypothetical protein
MTNLQEYLAGTNPQDRGSALRLEAVAHPMGVVLRFTAQAGKSYSLQFRNSLSSDLWQSYSNLGPFSVSQIVQLTDPATASGSQRWYRLTTPAAP